MRWDINVITVALISAGVSAQNRWPDLAAPRRKERRAGNTQPARSVPPYAGGEQHADHGAHAPAVLWSLTAPALPGAQRPDASEDAERQQGQLYATRHQSAGARSSVLPYSSTAVVSARRREHHMRPRSPDPGR